MKNRTFSPTGIMITLALMTIQGLAQSIYEPYTFTTLAGGGGFVSPDQMGTAARFSSPAGVAVDGAGNVYMADTFNAAIRKLTPQGMVTTLAGMPGSFGSADGTGRDARFNYPDKLAVDSNGNVFVADSGNSTIRKVTPEGAVTTLAGKAGSFGSANGTASSARFNGPEGVAVDNAGNVYVVDSGNCTIRKVAPAGTNWMVTTIAGLTGSVGSRDGTNSFARFNFPQGMAIDHAGNLYVGDTDNYTIRKLTPMGTNWVVTTIAGRAGSMGAIDGVGSSARLGDPKGVAVDSAGNVFVADEENHLVRKIAPEGTNWMVTTLAGKALNPGSADGTGNEARFVFPYDAAADSAGNVYIADIGNSAIRKVTPDGTNSVVTTLAGFGGKYGSADAVGVAARFKGPSAVSVDGTGSVYVADQVNQTIRKVSPDGAVTTLAGLAGYAGGANGTNGTARFTAPAGIAVTSAGAVYVGDNGTIRKMTPVGTNWAVTTLAGLADSQGSADGTGSAARFGQVSSMALDSVGNLYVADPGNHAIRRVTPAGAVTTRAGQSENPGSADGTGNAARFNNPSGVAVDSATNIYVADTWNHTIRKVTPARVVTTLAGLAGNSGSTDGIGTAARFNYPSGVAVDSVGNVYVADTYNNTIRKVTPVGTNWVVTTLGGWAGIFGTADGAGSAARFSNPNGIAVDSAGNLLVADFYFNTIRIGYPPPLFRNPFFNAGQFGSLITGQPGTPGLVVVEASTDLVNWLAIKTNSLAQPALIFSDPNASVYSKRFYRARLP